MSIVYIIRRILGLLPIITLLIAISFCYCDLPEGEFFFQLPAPYRKTEMYMVDGALYCSVNLRNGRIEDDLPWVYGQFPKKISSYNFSSNTPEIGEIVFDTAEIKKFQKAEEEETVVSGAYKVVTGNQTISIKELIYIVTGVGEEREAVLCAKIDRPFSVYQYTDWEKYAEFLQDYGDMVSIGCQSGVQGAYVSSGMTMSEYEIEPWFFDNDISRRVRMNWMCFFCDVEKAFCGEKGTCNHFV